MTLANWCVLIAALLPFVGTGVAKSAGIGKRRRDGGYDNNNPRTWLAQQQGIHQRANSAQANTFEALPFFIGAVALAQQAGANQGTIDQLAIAFVVLRVAYLVLYLVDQATLRSLAWVGALGCNIAILLSI